MEAGPRDTAPGAEHVTTEGDRPDRDEDLRTEGEHRSAGSEYPLADGEHSLAEADTEAEDRLTDDGPDETTDGVTADGPAPEEMYSGGPEVEVELRPQRRLRIWQLAPIVGLSALGSLMFAFPLAFDGDSGAVIAMLGLLLCCCAAGWGMMAARRVGYTWPGLPPRGSGRRPDWRVVLGYVLLVAVVAVLAVWRVARLR
ncbi:membrane protein [Streptomyces hygroscopicus subsp. hygroscopicus]|uniref:hypothetical protein n=1 Tax=Streptomyces sp. KHY 26 TaxID=3097359 RepID=UPI0024A47F5D|nr:hypothetical protein [Streptomyces hygroscopicus]GLX54091.1 membrane protein [Streptomyces hygroscopicus subsp. hygroscopicus]